MAREQLPQAERYTERHSRRKRWQKLVGGLACVVVFCTVYLLILPALTAEQDTYCGIEAHTHSAECYEKQLICGKTQETEENDPADAGHTHGADCYTEEQHLICGQEESEEHSHTAECYETERVLTCTEPEQAKTPKKHTHTDACYEEKLVCGKEEHQHSLPCFSNPKADVESKQVWERTMNKVELTGVWADDVIAIAESQLGYQESEKNYQVQADGKTLQGYTRYGDWYGDPYGDWCAMFVSFCLNYAKIPKTALPYEASCPQWVKTLASADWKLYQSAQDGQPAKGDLIFFDSDGDRIADHVGLVAELDEKTETLQVIEGNSKDQVRKNRYALDDKSILGVGKLPKNPKYTDPKQEDTEPDQTPEKTEPTDGKEATAEDTTPAGQTPLTEDSAYVDSLSMGETTVQSERDTANDTPETVRNQDPVVYPFTAKLQTYEEGAAFDAGRLKIEAVLPAKAETATFDLDAMPWLEQSGKYAPKVETETRKWDSDTTTCQVLTGYALLRGEQEGNAIPGTFQGQIVVKLTGAEPGDTISLQVSAATEFNRWAGTCATHDMEEKRTVAAKDLTVVASLSAEEQQAVYDKFLKEVEALEAKKTWDEETRTAAEDLLSRLEEARRLEQLTQEAYDELYARVAALLEEKSPLVGESCDDDTNWKRLRDSGWFEEYSDSAISTQDMAPRKAVMAATQDATTGEDAAPSSQQINEKGGPNTNADDGVSVSKTIAGTDIENVFDITLKVQTPEKIVESINEPDMAVVIVMDISNTMKKAFGNSTRYKAAMDSAEQFLDKFVKSSSLGVSKIGYVAFNTDAHKIFGLQSCTNETQAKKLKNTMRTETEKIINATGYGDAHRRFTNIEAGLAMGQDMLKKEDNKHKFIIFLSDGFPTTYMSDTTNYLGYDPYDTTGRFYDHVLNKPCSNGTSYSDEAAIRAKKWQ